jgi:nucleoside-diphosphate-sugar epimerase
MTKNTALITGGNGIIGRNLATYLETTGTWDIIVSSHSPLGYKGKFQFVQLDLTNPLAVAEKKELLQDVTHIFFGSYIQKQLLSDQTTVNTQLLENLVIGMEEIAGDLQHVTFIQGGKAYGAHLGKFKTPAKESDSRHFPPNFYYSQEDFLRVQSQGKKWDWTALRPDMVVGLAIGNPMNLATIIAVYATLCKEVGVPMRFPGSDVSYNALANVTDAELLAQGMEYVSLSASAKNDVFNITNGDIFRWKELWPKFGAYFNVEIDEPQTFSLATYMADKNSLWANITSKHQLADHSLDRLVQWPFGDFIFSNPHDAFFDVNKLRRIGFQKMQLDSFESFTRVFEQLKTDRIIPA